MMSIAAMKDSKLNYVASEITTFTEICHSENVKLKMILETSHPTDDKIVKLCEIGLDKIGATARTVKLIKNVVRDEIKIKAPTTSGH